MFKRRTPKSYLRMLADWVYPKGGWGRAISYVLHRLRRLPDPPHRIARGVAAGVFVCYTPFFGLHFFLAAFLAFLMQGNIVAALLATFFGNPVTFPLIMLGYFGVRFAGQGVMTSASRNVLLFWFARRRGLVSGARGVFVALGFSLAPLLLAMLIGHFGWRGALLTLA